MYDKLWHDLDNGASYEKIKMTSTKKPGGWINGVYVVQGEHGNIELPRLVRAKDNQRHKNKENQKHDRT